MFHLVSLSFANFPGSGVVVWCLLGCVLGFVFLVVFCSLPGKLLHPISFQFQTNFQLTDHVSYSPGNAGNKKIVGLSLLAAVASFFFCSMLLRCHSSCKEGPGQSAEGGKSRWGQNWCQARIGRTGS